MPRSWYVSPVRVIPGEPVPGVYVPSYYDYVGPTPAEMERVRGPFENCRVAVEAARVWREEEGKRSELFLVLTVRGECQHCNKYDPERH